MTSPELAQPLLTDADVLERVTDLVGPASTDRQLWLLFVDGDHQQAPVVLPIEGVSRVPEAADADALATVIAGFLPTLETDSGPGSVVFVLERLVFACPSLDDDAWADALIALCDDRGLWQRGVFVSGPDGVRRAR